MAKEYIDLYEPINILKQENNDIWIVDGPIVEMAMLEQVYLFQHV